MTNDKITEMEKRLVVARGGDRKKLGVVIRAT